MEKKEEMVHLVAKDLFSHPIKKMVGMEEMVGITEEVALLVNIKF